MGKAAYIRPKVVGPFPGPCASNSSVHWAALYDTIFFLKGCETLVYFIIRDSVFN
jgi:hypothetical protein